MSDPKTLVSTEINSIVKVVGSEEKAIELVAKAGFDCWDFSMFRMAKIDWAKGIATPTDHPLNGPGYLAFARKLKQIGLDFGITCNQSHAPFPSLLTKDYLKRSIEATAEAGGKICVIHPDNHSAPEQNAELYFGLLDFAKGCGVRIATENMWNWDKEKDQSSFAACATADSFVAHLDAVGDPFFGACLDIGHAEMRGSGDGAPEMIRKIGTDLLFALHIHDNDKWHDSHAIPFSMNIDFAPIAKALAEIGYKGELTLEADTHMPNHCTPENAAEGVAQLFAAADRFRGMFDAAKREEGTK